MAHDSRQQAACVRNGGSRLTNVREEVVQIRVSLDIDAGSTSTEVRHGCGWDGNLDDLIVAWINVRLQELEVLHLDGLLPDQLSGNGLRQRA